VDNSFGNSRKRPTLVTEVGLMRELLTVEETAERLRVSVPTVRWLRQEDKLPKAYKVGRRVLWDPQDLDAWLEGQRDPDWSP
jgi:excisionase family DNA binding protein